MYTEVWRKMTLKSQHVAKEDFITNENKQTNSPTAALRTSPVLHNEG